MHKWQTGVLAAGFLQRGDRFVKMRLQQMNDTEPAVPWRDTWLVRAEPDRLLEIGDAAVDRAGEKFAPSDMGVGRSAAAVERDRRLVFGDRLGAACFGAQFLRPRRLRQCVVCRCSQGW